MNNNILFTICARAGSKGVKSKNTRLFLEQPIAYYTLKVYLEFCRLYGKTYGILKLAVNTDSEILLEQLERTGIDFIKINREDALAGDVVSKLSVIKDTIKKAEEICDANFQIVIDLDLTSPLRKTVDIQGTLNELLNNQDADISFSVTEARRSPYFNMVCLKENGFYDRVIKSDYVARQQVAECYDMNASIYAYRREYLMSNREIERKAVIWKMRDTAVLDIDNEEDLELMEIIAEYLFQKDSAYDIYKEMEFKN